MHTNRKSISWWVLAVALAGLAVWPARVVMADSGLPDRNPPPATAPDSGTDDNSPDGAAIALTAWPPGSMSVVQWQDINGNWQDVDGWRGALDSGGHIRWWVAPKDFGSGPFRWVVGEAASEPFHLPGGGGQVVRIDLTASP